MDKLTIVVTGATGFIGSHFVAHAHAQGHRVIAVRRSATSAFRVPVPEGIELVERAIGELDVAFFKGVDALVHLAASGSTARGATWEECFKTNVTDSVAVILAAVEAGVSRVVAAGSYAEYGKAGLRFDPIPPDAPLEPTDPYAVSKATGCVAICGLARAKKFRLSYQRLFSVYGPGQYIENFWPALRKAALAGEDFKMTEGRQIRDFIPVEQVVEKLLAECLRSDLVPGEPRIRNLASGTPVALRDFATDWWQRFGAKGQLRLGEVPTRPNEVARFVPLV